MGKELLHRVYTGDGGRPEPGNAHGAPQVGDYASVELAKEAIKALRRNGRFFIEPVSFNRDLEAPEYSNAGPIEELVV